PEVDALFGSDRAEALLKTLHACAEREQPLAVRWACLLLDTGAEQIAAINSRCKAPRECAELALLARQHRGAWQDALELSAEALLALLQGFDVYRRPQRFEQFLAACEMAARGAGQEHEFRQSAYLRGAA